MCGIFGYTGHISKERASHCLGTLSHRGPDGSGLLQEEGITLGQTRLAILDLSPSGKQPMTYQGRYSITYNGEIYNFLEIKRELENKGYIFTSESDTEVLLAAYAEWKEKCLLKFNGMWALALWDHAKKELFLARDRFGKKPLYYSLIGKELAFGSEMKSITPLLATTTPDEELVKDVDHYFYYEATDRCLIKEIKRIPAGHFGYFRDGKLSLTRYWNTLDHMEDVEESYEDQVEHLRELLIDACKIRMRSDVPLGTALSGGLDSSAIFSIIGSIKAGDRIHKDHSRAFCASFEGTPLDEKEFAQKVAEHVKANLTIVDIDPLRYIDKLDTWMYQFEDVYITSPIPFVATYKAMRDNGVIVTLDGHGADEIFGGYSFDYLHIIHDELLYPRSIATILDTYKGSLIQDAQFKNVNLALFGAKQIVKNIGKHILRHYNISKDSSHPRWDKLDYFTQKLYISSHETVLPTLLRNYDRYSMIHGIEVRMPFMDHRVVTYGLSLPWTSKIRDGYTKAILRDAVAPFMPHEVAYRKTKVGFNSPITSWIRGPLQEWILDTISSQDFRNCDWIDHEKIHKDVAHIIDNPRATFTEGETLWKELSPYFWYRSFLKKVKAQ